MKKFIKKTAKGFTLVELIIVMAIFGVLMVAAMSLIGPVSKLFRTASVNERTYSYMNTVQGYVENALKYSENLWLYTANNVDTNANGVVDENELTAIAEQYRNIYYNDVVMNDSEDAATARFATGNVRILCLQNTNGGRISLRQYPFFTNAEITSNASPVEQLNEAYFSAQDSHYTFRYALGTSSMVSVDAIDPATGTYIDQAESFTALSMDRDNVDLADNTLLSAISSSNLALTIAAVKDNEIYPQTDALGHGYLAFKYPSGIAVANLPLMNINSRNNLSVSRPYWSKDPADPTSYLSDAEGAPVLAMQATNNSFICNIADTSGTGTATIDLDQDIYFVYSYSDELQLP